MSTMSPTRTVNEKKCYKCKLILPSEKFDKDNSHPSGLSGYCIPCRKMRRKKAWHNVTPEQKAARVAYYAEYRLKNLDRFRLYLQQWQVDNPLKCNQYAADRRARVAKAFIETIDFGIVYERDSGICGICGEFVDPKDFSLDHVVALVNGGLHCYANVQTSHLTCNLKKGRK